jgi:hypothetical protein
MRLLDHVVEHVSQAYERWGEVMMPVRRAACGGGGGEFGSRQGNLEVFLWSRLRGVDSVEGYVWGCEFEFRWIGVFVSRILIMRN